MIFSKGSKIFFIISGILFVISLGLFLTRWDLSFEVARLDLIDISKTLKFCVQEKDAFINGFKGCFD